MRNITRLLTIAVIMGLVVPQIVNAQSLKERKMHAEAEENMKEDLERLHKSCNPEIKFSFDWSGFDMETAKNNSIDGYCSNAVVDNISHLCENDEMWKSAVKDSIKTITCGFGSERTISLQEGNLKYIVSFNSSNDGKYAKEYLENNM